MVENKPKRRWQNLLHKKCPNCDTRLEDSRLYLVCPNPDSQEANKNCFFIKKDKAIEYLMTPDHPAHFCLNFHERQGIKETIAEW